MPNGKPNILLIMADDIGWFDVGAYHRGMMGGSTPNIMPSATVTGRSTSRPKTTGLLVSL